MNILIPIALWGWILAVLVFFQLVSPGRAVIVSFLFAWMFLPAVGYDLPGLPDYTKATAASFSVVLAVLLCDAGRLFSFRPSLADLPMAVWCLCPFVSWVTNGLGAYDGLSAVLENTVQWGVPYALGRMYLRDAGSLREAVVWLFIGGLIYVPLCLVEVRMSPQLNRWVYGFGGAGIEYATELGKWGSRPSVFMENRLALAMFMTAASLAGFWLWCSGGLKRLWGYPTGWLVILLICTTVMCKNMGALALLAAGMGCLLSIRYFRTSLVVYLLIAAAPLYMALRGTEKMGGDTLVSSVQGIHQRRAESLQTRLDNEYILIEKAMQRPMFGWGRWGRFRVYNEEGIDITLTDGLWVIALGVSGLVGLVAITASLLVPALAFTWRYPARYWLHPAIAPGGGLAVLIALYSIDCLFNAMLNPLYPLVMGGLVSMAIGRAPVPARPAPARPGPGPANLVPGWRIA